MHIRRIFFDSYTTLTIRNVNWRSKLEASYKKREEIKTAKKLYYSFHPFKLNTQSVPSLFHCLLFTEFVFLLFNHHALRDITFVPLSFFVVVLGAVSLGWHVYFLNLTPTRDLTSKKQLKSFFGRIFSNNPSYFLFTFPYPRLRL